MESEFGTSEAIVKNLLLTWPVNLKEKNK
jgi:hypothetical protein